MKRWCDFARESPALAEAGRALLYQHRVGLGYLATIRRDGGPRVHPICPVIADGGLYAFIGNRSPKPAESRDGRGRTPIPKRQLEASPTARTDLAGDASDPMSQRRKNVDLDVRSSKDRGEISDGNGRIHREVVEVDDQRAHALLWSWRAVWWQPQ